MKKIGNGRNGRAHALKLRNRAISKFALLIAVGLFLGLVEFDSFAQESDFKCLEECQTFRQDRTHAYDDCMNQAEAIADRMAAVRHKQYCRQRFPVLNCEQLPSCKQERLHVPETREGFQVSGLSLAVLQGRADQKPGQNIFYTGQTIWARYEVKIGKTKGDRLWFDQSLVVFDESGKEIFRDKTSFGREVGLSSTYSFKASFNVPDNFTPGKYRLKIALHERFSLWQGEAESSFQVLP